MNATSDRQYPLFRRNLRLEEMYKKVEERNNKIILKRRVTKKDLVWLFAVLLFAFSTPFTINKIQELQQLSSQAAKAPKTYAFEAESGVLTGGASVNGDVLTSAGKYVDLGPNVSDILDLTRCPLIAPTVGRLVMHVQAPSDGTYYYWIRARMLDELPSTFYLSVDGNCSIPIGGNTYPRNTYVWINTRTAMGGSRIVFDLTQGTHTLSLVGLRPFMSVDRILLTSDTTCVPVLKGDNCLQK